MLSWSTAEAVVAGAPGAWLLVEERTERILFASETEALFSRWGRAPDEWARGLGPHVEAALSSASADAVDLPLGSGGWVSVRARRTDRAPGAPSGLLVLIEDVTERRQLREELHRLAGGAGDRSTADRWTTALRATDEGVWDWDVQTGEMYWSEGLRAQLGHPALGLQGVEEPATLEAFLRCFSPETADGIEQKLRAHVEGGLPVDLEVPRLGTDGLLRWYRLRGRSWADTPERRRVAGTLLDVTAERTARIALEENSRRLERVNAELERFAVVASHDLKEPVRKLGLLVELALEDGGTDLDPLVRQRLERARVAAARMRLMIEDLLAIARVPSALEQEPFDLVEAVRGAAADLGLEGTRADEPGDPVRLEVDPLPVVLGSYRASEQIFRNLFDNAMKYRRPGVLLTIEVRHHPQSRAGRVCVEVRDDGSGFDPKYRERIFEPFKRATAVGEGSGLGLSLCRKLMESQQGRIWAEGRPGCGASFFLEWPSDPAG